MTIIRRTKPLGLYKDREMKFVYVIRHHGVQTAATSTAMLSVWVVRFRHRTQFDWMLGMRQMDSPVRVGSVGMITVW